MTRDQVYAAALVGLDPSSELAELLVVWRLTEHPPLAFKVSRWGLRVHAQQVLRMDHLMPFMSAVRHLLTRLEHGGFSPTRAELTILLLSPADEVRHTAIRLAGDAARDP